MRIRYPIALLLACLLAAGTAPKSRAQQRLSLHPRDITRLHEAFPKAARKWTHDLDRVSKNRLMPLVGLMEHGLVLVALDGQSLRCIGPGDQVLWQVQAPPRTFIQAIRFSPDGRYLYLYNYRDEDNGADELWSSQGQRLWSRPNAGEGYDFSRSGDYMISQPDLMDNIPAKVLETRTGRPLWTHRFTSGALEAVADLGDRLVYIAGDTVYAADLTTGRRRWRRALGTLLPGNFGYAHWSLAASGNGRRVALMELNARSLSSHVVLFSDDGRVLWKREDPGVGRLIGLTPNGKFLGLVHFDRSGRSLSLLSVDTGGVIWTMEGVGGTGAAMMNNALFVTQHYGTLIFTIDRAGRLTGQDRVNRLLMAHGRRLPQGGRGAPGFAQGASLEFLFADIQEQHLSFAIESMEIRR